MKDKFSLALNDNLVKKITQTWKEISSQDDDAWEKEKQERLKSFVRTTDMLGSGFSYPEVRRTILTSSPKTENEVTDTSPFNKVSEK